MKRKNVIRLLTVLIGLNLALIWGNSLLPGADSGAISGGIVAWLGQFLPFFATEQGHHFLRKAAHFSEFCLLGLLTAGRTLALDKPFRLSLAGFGMAAACVDETIQIYVPDRGSSVLDVWMDTAGFVTGILLLRLGHDLIHNTKQQKGV